MKIVNLTNGRINLMMESGANLTVEPNSASQVVPVNTDTIKTLVSVYSPERIAFVANELQERHLIGGTKTAAEYLAPQGASTYEDVVNWKEGGDSVEEINNPSDQGNGEPIKEVTEDSGKVDVKETQEPETEVTETVTETKVEGETVEDTTKAIETEKLDETVEAEAARVPDSIYEDVIKLINLDEKYDNCPDELIKDSLLTIVKDETIANGYFEEVKTALGLNGYSIVK